MKLLTFLGVARYEPTVYSWNDQEYATRFSPVASNVFLKPQEMIVFLTEEAHQQVYPDFCAAISKGPHVTSLSIPLGKDEPELWQIFERISGCVEPGEEVAFDITNGLRSFPLVGLLAAAYLRTALDVRLRAVLYGAFDVGKLASPGHTPMFDLSPMLALLEWTSAADRFNRTGDARFLAGLLKGQQKGLAKQAGKDRELLEQAGALGSLATGLSEISQALHLIRPAETAKLTADLPRRILKARPALERTAAAKPFGMLLETVEKSFSPLGIENPLNFENLPAFLERQRRMIRRYVEWEQWVQAVTLAREWLVSWFMIHLGLEAIDDLKQRKEFEERINSEGFAIRKAKEARNPLPKLALVSLPGGESALDLWNALIYVRNDIDHAGMREQPRLPKSLIEQTEESVRQIELLQIPRGQP